MFLSGSHPVTAGEEVDVKVEATRMPTENDHSLAESLKHGITYGSDKNGISHMGASSKPYCSTSERIECSNMSSFHCNPVFSEEPDNVEQEADLMQTQVDPLAIMSTNPPTVTVKMENEFTSEDETNLSGSWWRPNHSVSNQTTNGSYMSASGNCFTFDQESVPVKVEDNLMLIQNNPCNLSGESNPFSQAADSRVGEIKREEFEVRNNGTTAPEHNNLCSGSISAQETTILFKEEDLDEGEEGSTTPLAPWGCNVTSAGTFCENVNYENTLGQTFVFSGTVGSFNRQQSPSGCNTNRIKVKDVSAMLDDLFQDKARHSSKGFSRNNTNYKSCTCVMCSVKYVPPVEIRRVKESNTRKSSVCPKKPPEGCIRNPPNTKPCMSIIRVGEYPPLDIRNLAKIKTRKSDVSVHIPPKKKFVKEDWISCSDCPAGFKFRHALKKHLSDEHSIYVCIECGEKFECKSDLCAHLKVHPVNKPYVCVFCSFNSKTEAELKIHVRSHSTSKVFSCIYCRVEFETNLELLDHLLIHPKERPLRDDTKYKPFQCVECGVQFTDKRSLRRHAERHSKTKRYSCLNCKARFTTKDSLKKHEVCHLNEKPFSCEYCSMIFTSATHLKLHSLVHNEKRLSGKLVFKSERQQNSYVCSFQ